MFFRTILSTGVALTLLAGNAGAQSGGLQNLVPTTGGRTAPASLSQSTTGQSSGSAASLSVGSAARGDLRRGDDTLSSGEYTDAWRFRGRRGQTYTLNMSSGDFDPYVIVRGPGGLSEENDDDPAARGSTDSRLTFTLPADGEVTVSATSYESGETGSYALRLDEGGRGSSNRPDRRTDRQPDRQPDRAQTGGSTIRVGDTRDGRLGSSSETLGSGEYVDSFTLRGRRGQRLDLRMSSTEFDPFIQIAGPDDFEAFNDDDTERDGSHDSRLIVTLPADGDYTLWATSYEAGEAGQYRLMVADAGSVQPPRPSPLPGPTRPDTGNGGTNTNAGASGLISVGATVGGSLGSGDDTLGSGEYVDHYRFVGRRGQRVAVELTSSAFDAYTILRTPSGEQIENDDGEDGTDSRLDTVLAQDGEYVVDVTSFAAGETGSYRFSVTPGQAPARQATVQGGPRVFAVMVGVSEYGEAANDLAYTDEDARKLAETLRREGVLNPASVTLTNAQATVSGVRSAFQRVAQQAGPDDMFLFFFSGHGAQGDEGTARVGPLEPDGRAESIVLRDGEISDTEMAGLFGTLRTRLSLLVLDSCFSGGFARNVVDRPGVMGLFSSEEDLTSAVAEKFEAGGYLAHFLRAGLSGDADVDGDALVTAGELSNYLRRQFRVEVEDVESVTQDGQRNYQNLVIDRGGVQIDDVVVRLAGTGGSPVRGR